MSEMFCFQCQQTAGGKCCVSTGVCGKQPETAHLQDELVRELIGLAEAATAAGQRTPTADRLLADGLFTTLTNVNFDDEAICAFIGRVEEALRRCGATFEGEERRLPSAGITRADLMDKGLMGPNSAAKRAAVLQTLQLPEHLTTTGLLDALNLLLTREEFDTL